MDYSYGQCAKCPFQGSGKLCRAPETGRAPDHCATRRYEEALSQVDYSGLAKFAAEASRQEGSNYSPSPYNSSCNRSEKPRILEIMEFCHRMGYQKLGLAFCDGLRVEARLLTQVLENAGFQVVSVVCKVGGVDKCALGLSSADKIHKGDGHETMCNPLGQAAVLNAEHTDFNLVLGLCVGHDSMFLKASEAMCTIVAVKDRLTGHAPLTPLYQLESYYAWLKAPGKAFQEEITG